MKKYLLLITWCMAFTSSSGRHRNEICLAYNTCWYFDKYPIKRNFGSFPYLAYRREIKPNHGILFHSGFLYAKYNSLNPDIGIPVADQSHYHRQSYFIGLGYYHKKSIGNMFDNRINAGFVYRVMNTNRIVLSSSGEASGRSYAFDRVPGINIGNSIKKNIFRHWALVADVQYIHYFNRQTVPSWYNNSPLKDPQRNILFFNAGIACSF